MEKEVQEITEAKQQVTERDFSSHTPMMQQYLLFIQQDSVREPTPRPTLKRLRIGAYRPLANLTSCDVNAAKPMLGASLRYR